MPPSLNYPAASGSDMRPVRMVHSTSRTSLAAQINCTLCPPSAGFPVAGFHEKVDTVAEHVHPLGLANQALDSVTQKEANYPADHPTDRTRCKDRYNDRVFHGYLVQELEHDDPHVKVV